MFFYKRQHIKSPVLFGTINLHSLLNGLEFLVLNGWPGSRLAEDHLRFQAPSRRHLELGLQSNIDDGVVVLQVHPQSFCFQRGPDCTISASDSGILRNLKRRLTDELMHPIGLFRPSREFVLVGLEFVLELSHRICILIEENLFHLSSTIYIIFHQKRLTVPYPARNP